MSRPVRDFPQTPPVKDPGDPADALDVPIQTRCPSCAAAVPSSAAWCSLCHADLRPPVDVTSVDVSDASAATPGADDADVESVETTPRGRHSAHVVDAPEGPSSAATSGGRHSANRGRSVPRPSVSRASVSRSSGRRAAPNPGAAVLDGIELPSGEVTPEEVDALADRMLTRLAVTETRAGVLDPADLPGGKWGFAAAVMAAVVLLLLALSTVVGLVVNH